MSSNIRQYLIEHNISEDCKGILVHENRDKIEIRVYDKDSFYLFSKYRMFTGDIKYTYDKGSKMALYNEKTLYNKSYINDDVYIVEGEFDCIALNKIYPVVITSTGGCTSWKDEWTEVFKNRNIKICFDNDAPGRKASMSLYKKLIGNVNSIEILSIQHYNDICEQLYHTGIFNPEISIPKEISIMLSEKVKSKAQINRMQATIENTIQNEFYRNELLSIISDMYRKIYQPKPIYINEKDDIKSIRKIPITQFVNFTNGVACCVFHNERNPSMYYNDERTQYPNTVKCYSCGKFGDVIDVVMALENTNFKGAVNLLKNNFN